MSLSEHLAIIIPTGQANPADLTCCYKMAEAIKPHAPFDTVDLIKIDGDDGPIAQRNRAIDKAVELNATWIFFVEPDEQATSEVLSCLLPALASYDGLWGGIALLDDRGCSEIAKPSLFSSSDITRNFHMALHWWVGKSHFVRTEVADRVRFDPDAGDAWYADYLLRMWETANCLKSAQPITSRSGELPGLSEADRNYLAESLRQHPRYFAMQYHEHQIYFPYTGRNPTLERIQLRGLFYEQPDLECLIPHVKPGAVCVDVGANTGNHTIFFEKVLGASKVIPIEPNPDTIVILRQVIEKNGLNSIDVSKLGMGVGRSEGRFDLKMGRRGYLGTARLEPGHGGSIHVQPLDILIDVDVDLIKIDVEMMEIEVLEGASSLISRCQPVLLIEAQDDNIAPLYDFLSELSYRIEQVFPDQGYANYLALPIAKDQAQ